MPRSDPVERRKYQTSWAKQAMRNGYGKWLYQKRKRINQDAEEFQEALLRITQSKDVNAAARIARKALKDSGKRWETLGPPHTHLDGAKTVFEVPDPGDDSLLDALSKLGLS